MATVTGGPTDTKKGREESALAGATLTTGADPDGDTSTQKRSNAEPVELRARPAKAATPLTNGSECTRLPSANATARDVSADAADAETHTAAPTVVSSAHKPVMGSRACASTSGCDANEAPPVAPSGCAASTMREVRDHAVHEKRGWE